MFKTLFEKSALSGKGILSLALRNLSRQKQRSLMLAIAIAFGFFVVTGIDGLATGALNNLKNTITRMFGGNVLISGTEHEFDEDGKMTKKTFSVIRDANIIQDVLTENNIEYEYFFQRTTTSGEIIFNGKRLMASIYGCDFASEAPLLDSFVLVDGSLDNIWGRDSLVINESAQRGLNVEVGERVLFTTTTLTGQKTVGEFTVAAVTRNTTLLDSMMLYAPKAYINELLEMPEGGFDFCAVNLGPERQSKQNAVAQQIEDALRARGVLVTSREDALKNGSAMGIGRALNKQIDAMAEKGTIYSVYSLEDNMPALETVVSVVHTVTTIILVVIFLIVMVGISNTYRMVLYERIREIGTMRAVGMTGKHTGWLFTTEAVILSLLGAFGGFLLSIVVMWIVSLFYIDNEIVSFFLHNGHISFALSFGSVVSKYLLIMVLTMLAVHGTAKNAANMAPADALRSTK